MLGPGKMQALWILMATLAGNALHNTEGATLPTYTDACPTGGSPHSFPQICRNRESPSTIRNKHLPYCSLPMEDLPKSRQIPGNTPRGDSPLPSWMNKELAVRGQKVFQEWILPMNVAQIDKLHLTSMMFPDFREVLLFTGILTTHPLLSGNAQIAFIQQFLIWLTQSLSGNHDDLILSLIQIRKLHQRSADGSNFTFAQTGSAFDTTLFQGVELTRDKAMWDAFFTDLNASNIPHHQRHPPSTIEDIPHIIFNQQSNLVCWFDLAGLVMLKGASVYGIHMCKADWWAYNHIMAVLAFALGVENDWNPALKEDFDQQMAYYEDFFNQHWIPALFNFPVLGQAVVQTMLQGTAMVTPAYTIQSMLYRLLTQTLGIPAPHFEAIMSEPEKANYHFVKETLNATLMQNAAYRSQLSDKFYQVFDGSSAKLRGPTCNTKNHYLSAKLCLDTNLVVLGQPSGDSSCDPTEEPTKEY